MQHTIDADRQIQETGRVQINQNTKGTPTSDIQKDVALDGIPTPLYPGPRYQERRSPILTRHILIWASKAATGHL